MGENARARGREEDHLLEDDDEDTQANKYLFFRISKESYGIGIKHIIEIIELQSISAVPDMPEYVKGVINLRGKVIPIVDLRLRFGMSARDYDDRTCIVVTEIDGVLIGFVVDTVEEVLEIPESGIEEAPRFKSVSGRERYILGMGKVGEAVKILLDIEKIARGDEMAMAARVEQAAV
ncbi:MAG: purine-binding chemotaxis protein CheW [Spirochaetaceae bacterium]|nr:purine-binding chemotaxis protein CheW [Spirochaetaceae bacterium]